MHQTGFLHQKSLKIQGISRSFHSIIQDPSSSQSFHSIQLIPVLKKKTRIWSIHALHLLIKRFKQFFYQLNSNNGMAGSSQSPSLVETFTIDKFQTFQGHPLFFDSIFSVFWNSKTFQGWPWIQGWRRNPVQTKIPYNNLISQCYSCQHEAVAAMTVNVLTLCYLI